MNKTKDGRFIEKRVMLPTSLLRKLIFKVKKDKAYTWKRLANMLGLSEQTIRVDWFRENRTIPLSKFKRLISMNKNLTYESFENKLRVLDPFWGQRLISPKSFKQGIKFPKVNSEQFAEFYGILLGDGCIYTNMNCFCITGDKILEKNYYEIYLNSLIKYLFGVNPAFTRTKNQRVIRCYLYSKKITSFLRDFGFPPGIKQNIEIPSSFFKNKRLLIKCLRGFFDTDGSLSRHPHSKIMIHLSITQEKLKDSIAKALTLLKIPFSRSKKAIFLYSKNAINFMNKIGSSNTKNIYKYEQFLKNGKVPSSKETESFLIKER